MRYFVLHEFNNSTRNTDPYDTISAHSGSVFVPLYMSKQGTDAKGRQFVVVVQVAPFDVVSSHAANRGSAGPGMEVAKNVSDALEPLQALAGILVVTMIKTAAPQLEIVNHADAEGLPMLRAYDRRLATLRARPGAPMLELPFVRAQPTRVATAVGSLSDLIAGNGASPPVPISERALMAKRYERPDSATEPMRSASLEVDPVPRLIGPIRPAIRPAVHAEPTLIGPILPATRRALAEPTLVEPIKPARRPVRPSRGDADG
jgi:hypothetical protein